MRVRLSASAPKGEPQPCIRQSPRAQASRGPAARRDAPGSRTASPGDRPFREVRVLEEQLSRPETAIPPTVPVSWVLPSVAKLLGHLLLAHPSSPSHSFLCIGQCVCYSRRSPSLKKLDTSAPLRPQRYYGIKRLVLGASTKWAIIGHRLRVANFGELHKGEVQRIHLLGPRVNKDTRKAGCIRARPRRSGREGTR